ncbi:MAG TPA: hypothetical protein DET40_16955 [Lentisphaeria bacterium]|nr:MAG: hypothetical protein A2X45_01485 [Lentisphaerae bacterium GWF2_50_93]HCE45231.1 hypothetical protein [Lentisphaeria bacterium]
MLFSTDSIRLTFADPGKGTMTNDGWVHRKAVPYIIIAQPLEGRYTIECGDGRSSEIRTGEAFLTAPNVPLAISHHCDPRSKKMIIRFIHFNFTVFDAINLADLFELPLCVEKQWANRFGEIADKMLLVKQSEDLKSIKYVARINELGFSVLHLLVEYLESRGIVPHINPSIMRLLPVLEYARRHLDQKLEVADLAKRANLSIPRFHAEFKRLFGDSPLDHVRKMRLSKSSDMLRSSSSSLEEIAQLTGFCNQFHFSREFKKCYGYPPTVFRKNISKGLVV